MSSTSYTRFKTVTLCGLSTAAFIAASSMAAPALAQATRLPGITIYSTTPQLPGDAQTAPHSNASASSVADPESRSRAPSIGDSGEFLRHITGIDAGRMGGHGLDPVIRGLDQNQLGITNDGAFHFGGCPSRMDPPTSHMQLYSYDQVIAKRGFQSVLDGPPAPGGTIAFERVHPSFAPGDQVTSNLKAGAGYNSNGEGKEAFIDMSVGNDWGYVRGFGSYGSANNYDDGMDNEIRSSFDQYGGGVIVGRTFDADSWVTLKIENNNVDDALFPGAGMDAPITDDWTYQLKAETDVDWGNVHTVSGDIYRTTVDHVMNTFDLRDQEAIMPPSARKFFEARMQSDTLGGKLVFSGTLGETDFDIGADYRDVARDGNKYGAKPNDPNRYDPTAVSAVLWPDTSIKEMGVFGEAVLPLSQDTSLTVGARYDRVEASADNADMPTNFGPTPGRTPNQVYQAVYGANANDDKTENNFSGLLRVAHDMGDGVELFGSVSRAVRTADATERYMANMMGCPGTPNAGCMSWVGNPDIKPEKHHQADIGARYQGDGVHLTGSIFYNHVDDYIQRYNGQNVGAPYMMASIYRNIDATLAGAEAEMQVQLSQVWTVNLSAAYTHGENRTDDIPLGQIPPLSGRFELVYDNTDLMAGLRITAAAAQTRIDSGGVNNNSQQDLGKTDAWRSVDLFGAYNLTDNVQISAGITNLLDKTYANHLNKELLGQSVRVNEPGRSVYLRAVTKL